jgi:hypothetical protein
MHTSNRVATAACPLRAQLQQLRLPMVAVIRFRQLAIKKGRHALGAAPAPDFGWLQPRMDAEGRTPTGINEVKDLLLEPAMGAQRLVC